MLGINFFVLSEKLYSKGQRNPLEDYRNAYVRILEALLLYPRDYK